MSGNSGFTWLDDPRHGAGMITRRSRRTREPRCSEGKLVESITRDENKTREKKATPVAVNYTEVKQKPTLLSVREQHRLCGRQWGECSLLYLNTPVRLSYERNLNRKFDCRTSLSCPDMRHIVEFPVRGN